MSWRCDGGVLGKHACQQVPDGSYEGEDHGEDRSLVRRTMHACLPEDVCSLARGGDGRYIAKLIEGKECALGLPVALLHVCANLADGRLTFQNILTSALGREQPWTEEAVQMLYGCRGWQSTSDPL